MHQPTTNNNLPIIFSSIPTDYQPITDIAINYGNQLANQGKSFMGQKLERWFSLSRLKYYFAVDTNYVGRKLLILICPYIHKDWALQYDQEKQPIAPRFDINAPDLYIPFMSFMTFILTSGWILGVQNKFSPEQLGIRTSSCLVWQLIEVLTITILLYLMNTDISLCMMDILAFTSYKYVGIIACSIIGIFAGSQGYYMALAYFGLSIGYFLIKTLRIMILPNACNFGETHPRNDLYANKSSSIQSVGTRQKVVSSLLLSMCFLVQPLLMFIITYHLIPTKATPSIAQALKMHQSENINVNTGRSLFKWFY